MKEMEMNRMRIRCRLSGFTLIELLVVIAIIALLVSILLPSLQRSKDLADCVTCLSNARNLYVAQSVYAEENAGSLPNYVPYGMGNNRAWRASYSFGLSMYSSPVEMGAVLVAGGYGPAGLFGCPDRAPYPQGIGDWLYRFDTDEYLSWPPGGYYMRLFSNYIFRVYAPEVYSPPDGSNGPAQPATEGVLNISRVEPGMGMVADIFTWYYWLPHMNLRNGDNVWAMNVVWGDGHGEFLRNAPIGPNLVTWVNWGVPYYGTLALDGL